MAGTVLALGVAPEAGAPIEPRDEVRVEVARGVVGDRYARGAGTWQGYPDQDVTLAEAEDAEAAGVAPLALRRNVVTRGVRLEELVGRTFRLGGALLHGVRPCLPCAYLEKMLGLPGLKDALRGGLRARVVRAGAIRVGDAVEPVDARLDDDMRAVVESAHLAFVATVTPDGRPSLSPKGTLRALDDRRLFFLDVASPQTRRNLERNPWMEVNVVDATSRRGYRFLGQAAVHRDDDLAREAT
ncbi:MAG TPA: pyridoxamine 5'-phosphate oxidase family protein, partial [Candidatus Thermoplasmatota archaeon]|nr:pyridoxamine 5'-phosphate oxidase family protein [Candidatus Thermoplasmatota archaeon]